MNEHGKELYLEILRLCDGADAVQAITALTTALSFAIAQSATPDRIEPLTRDVIRSLRTSVRKMRERAGSPLSSHIPTVN
jgi:hypothetical protein